MKVKKSNSNYSAKGELKKMKKEDAGQGNKLVKKKRNK